MYIMTTFVLYICSIRSLNLLTIVEPKSSEEGGSFWKVNHVKNNYYELVCHDFLCSLLSVDK